MKILGFGNNIPISKSLNDITKAFTDILEDLKTFTKEKTE